MSLAVFQSALNLLSAWAIMLIGVCQYLFHSWGLILHDLKIIRARVRWSCGALFLLGHNFCRSYVHSWNDWDPAGKFSFLHSSSFRHQDKPYFVGIVVCCLSCGQISGCLPGSLNVLHVVEIHIVLGTGSPLMLSFTSLCCDTLPAVNKKFFPFSSCGSQLDAGLWSSWGALIAALRTSCDS